MKLHAAWDLLENHGGRERVERDTEKPGVHELMLAEAG